MKREAAGAETGRQAKRGRKGKERALAEDDGAKEAFQNARFCATFPRFAGEDQTTARFRRAKTLWFTSLGLIRIANAVRVSFVKWEPLAGHSQSATARVHQLANLYGKIKPLRAQIMCTLRGAPVETHVTLCRHGKGLRVCINDPLALDDTTGIRAVHAALRSTFLECGGPHRFAADLLRRRKEGIARYPPKWEARREMAVRAYTKLYNKIVDTAS